MPYCRILALVGLCLATGCYSSDTKSTPSGGANTGAKKSVSKSTDAPSFSLAWSEYPSWSVFGVAEEKGLIDGDEGEQGPVEEEWNVDIVLKQADYDPCLTMFGTGNTDAVCITNMDVLAPSLGRDAVAVLPTSTSVGADACIVVGIDSLDELKGKVTKGLAKSVSQYCFERNLELENRDPKDFPFENMDPGAAAQAMQAASDSDDGVQSIMVWNPFVLQTLRTREGAKRLFDSSTIPEEIIDMVVIGKDSLAKPGGDDFACAIIDIYYRMNRLLEDPKEGDDTLVALGAKFSKLGLEDMKQVVKETRFYATPEAALKLIESEKFQNETMPQVVDFCESHEIVDKKPSVGFGQANADLNFDTRYLKRVQKKNP